MLHFGLHSTCNASIVSTLVLAEHFETHMLYLLIALLELELREALMALRCGASRFLHLNAKVTDCHA